MSLQTGKPITHPRVTACKMTSAGIASVEARAKKDGVKTLKFFNRKKESILLIPNDLSTGVGENNVEYSSEDDSDYVPSSDDDDSSDSGSEMDEDLIEETTPEEGERISEALDQEDDPIPTEGVLQPGDDCQVEEPEQDPEPEQVMDEEPEEEETTTI